MSDSPTKSWLAVTAHVLALLAASLWLGGMIVLGAVVAPVVFGIVPAPTSADAMTVVFRRFDAVAMSCTVVVLAAELYRARATPKIERIDLARGASVLVAGALAIVEGLSVSPHIESLHRAGAIRGVGALGTELESAHRVAEALSKCEAFFVAVFLVLWVCSSSVSPLRSGAKNVTLER